MKINFHVKYDSGEKKFDYLDSYYGSDSLLGVSRVLLISLNAYFNREIITQATSAKGFRLVLGPSRSGSLDQLIQLIISSPELMTVVQDMGKNALYDLLKFGLLGGVGVPFVIRHRKAKRIIADLRKENDDLQEKLDDALMRAHAPVKHQGLSLKIKAERTELVTFDQNTLAYLETEIVEKDVLAIDVCVSRFNARTGTGRFISKIDSISYPFYPENKLSAKRKAILADNLAQLVRGQFEPIIVHVSRVTSQDGRLKSYILHGVESRRIE